MKLGQLNTSRRDRYRAGFTMVEIAFSVAIVAFAMVAILGVLPRGLKVQKENKEDTILNLDGPYLLEAIRSGSRGLNELTNYFESITIRTGGTTQVYTNGPGPLRLLNGEQIIGLLSIPKYERRLNASGSWVIYTNHITARVRAISGLASEKNGLTNEFAFRYFLTSEVIPFIAGPVDALANDPLRHEQANHLRDNLYDIRLVLRGPIFQRGNQWESVGRPRVFRTQASGELMPTNGVYFFNPYTFSKLSP